MSMFDERGNVSFDDDLGRDPEKERAGDDFGSDKDERNQYPSLEDMLAEESFDDMLGRESSGKAGYGEGSGDLSGGILEDDFEPEPGVRYFDEDSMHELGTPGDYTDEDVDFMDAVLKTLKKLTVQMLIATVAPPLLGAIYKSGKMGELGVRAGLGMYQTKKVMDDVTRKADTLGKVMGHAPGEGLRPYEGGPRAPAPGTESAFAGIGGGGPGQLTIGKGAAPTGTPGTPSPVPTNYTATQNRPTRTSQLIGKLANRGFGGVGGQQMGPQKRRSRIFNQ